MAADSRAGIVEANPLGSVLNTWVEYFDSVRAARSLSTTDVFDHLTQEGKYTNTSHAKIVLTFTDIEDLTLELLCTLQSTSTARSLPSNTSHGTLRDDLHKLISAVASETFDSVYILPLLNAVAARKSDADIWDCAYTATTEFTPTVSSLQETPWLHNTCSFANSSEYRQYVDGVLKSELGPLYVEVCDFRSIFLEGVDGLAAASDAVFKRCTEGDDVLFTDGWKGWPSDANQEDVLSWLADISETLAEMSREYIPTPSSSRRALAQPNKTFGGSTADRKLDIGFVSDASASKNTRCQWSQILVPGELKSNPAADMASKAWLDLGRYAREVLAAQDGRRFVLGFTLCNSSMRIWAFDRLGGIASDKFDINEDGLQFVSTILAFLWMSEADCGFDPTIIKRGGQRIVEIERDDGHTERLVLERVMRRAPCIAGRATTCWKAYSEADPGTPLVVKDSWQYTERDEEGELLQEATERGVINVARYYHHATVYVRGKVDDVQENVRGGLDIRTASNFRPERSTAPSSTSVSDDTRKGQKSAKKRSSSEIGAYLPPSKRSSSASATKVISNPLPNRVHRRVVIRDYGKPIYKASTHAAFLAALEGCITGHQSLRSAGILHRDISVNNLLINEDKDNPSWPSFLIDLDLAIKEQRGGITGASGIAGTRAFMAIDSLLGEKHSFMHDLESFFWVLFWICIHYKESGKGRVVPRFDKWNYMETGELATLKTGLVADETIFMKNVDEFFTEYYQPLIPCVKALRRAVFSHGRRWKKDSPGLYDRMKKILQDAKASLEKFQSI